MRSHIKKIILSFILVSCSTEKDQIWNALVLGLPSNLGTVAANVNMGLYVVKQTHEPLFRLDKYGQFYSQVLTSWERNRDYTSFTFCPDSNLQFNKDQFFNQKFLSTFLKSYSKKNGYLTAISEIDTCTLVKVREKGREFLSNLTKYENAPTLEGKGKTFEYGLGKFQIEDFNKTKLIMKRKKDSSDGYNTIIFKTYEGPKDTALKNKNYEDFNRVFITDVPDWVKADFKSFDVQLLQSVNLVINIPNKEHRKRIFNCIDVSKFRRAFANGQTKFANIGNILPVGVSGGKPVKVNQNCKRESESVSYPFYNWKADNHDSLEKYFNEIKVKGINLKLENHSLDDFVSSVFKQPHPYKLTVMAFDATVGSHEPFFTHLVKKHQAVIDSPILKASDLLDSLLVETNEVRKEELVIELLRHLKESYYILPLYQEQRAFYYPKHVKNINLGNNFLEFPEIGELKID